MKKFLSVIALVILTVASGCVRVDYVGQKFPVLPEGEYVEFYRNLSEVPTDLKPIGRGTALLPMSMIDDDIYLVFAKKAAEVGATAVAVSESKKVLIGVTNEIASRPTRPDADWTIDSTDGVGRDVYSNTFGREEELKVVNKTHYKLKMTAVFYVPIDVYNEYLQKPAEETEEKSVEETEEKTEVQSVEEN